MAIADYDGLLAAVASTLNREDLTADIPNWVSLAEERHKTDVRIREILEREEVEIDARYIALPTGFLEMKLLRAMAVSGGDPYTVDEVSSAEMTVRRQRAIRGQQLALNPWDRPANIPRYYAVDDNIEFDVDPSEFTEDEPFAEILFYKAVTPLSSSVASNAILARAPGVYLYGALVHSAPFLLNDERIETWEGAYTALVTGLNKNDRKRAGPLVSRVVGSTP
jgi:hypothetical protein